MSRAELLKQVKEKDRAYRELAEKYIEPSSVKYDLFDDGNKAGTLEYFPNSDEVLISKSKSTTDAIVLATSFFSASIKGSVLKSVRDVLNKLLDE